MDKDTCLKKNRAEYEAEFIRYLYFFTLPLLIGLYYINYTTGAIITAYSNIFAFGLLSLSAVLFRTSTREYVAKSMILFALLVLHMFTLLYSNETNSSFFYFFIYPLIALFLCDRKTAFAWIGQLFVAIVVTIFLIKLSYLATPYDVDLLYTLFLALSVEVYILNYMQNVLLNYKYDFETLKSKLLTTNTLVDKYFLIIRTDLEGRIVDANEAFLSLSLYTREEIVGVELEKLCSGSMETYLQKEYCTGVDSDDYNCVVECMKANGTLYWVDTRMVPEYDIHNKQIGFLIFQQDVSQRVALEQVSITDTLTQLNNRLHFDEVSSHRLEEFKRYKNISSLVICDIDNFKDVNDKYGHLKGDEILKSIASLLRASTRTSDTISRWGGEEFAVLLPLTDHKNAMLIAQKMCDAINDYDFGLDERVTASFGVATTMKGDTRTSWFANADKALYEAKKSGKGKVCSL